MTEVNAQSKPRGRAFLSFAIKAIVSVGLLSYLLFTQIDNMSDIWNAMHNANPALLVLAFSLNVFGYLLCSWRWQILLAAQKFAVSLIELIRAYTIGIFFNAFLPGLMSGDFMRAYDISDRVDSYTRSFLILFVERLTGMFGLLALAALALPFVGQDILVQTGIHWIMLVVSIVLIAASIGLVFMRKERSSKSPMRIPGAKKLRGISQKVTETAHAFGSRMDAVYKCMVISFVFQANVVLHYYLIGVALGIELPVWVYFGIIPISLFVMMIPASVNGIGIREQIFVYLFGAFGVSAAEAISLAWIAFGMVLLQAAAGGLVFALRRKNHQANPKEPTAWSEATGRD